MDFSARYKAMARSGDLQERRLALAQLERLERAGTVKTHSDTEVTRQFDLVALIGQAVLLKRVNSGKWVGGCPWHSSKSGSCLTVWKDKGRWKCWSCRQGGDAVYEEFRKESDERLWDIYLNGDAAQWDEVREESNELRCLESRSESLMGDLEN